MILTESKKYNSYRLSWFDLDEIKDKYIEKYICCEYIRSDIIDFIKNDFAKYDVAIDYNDEFLTDKDTVIFNANIKTKKSNAINVSFKKYLPKNLTIRLRSSNAKSKTSMMRPDLNHSRIISSGSVLLSESLCCSGSSCGCTSIIHNAIKVMDLRVAVAR